MGGRLRSMGLVGIGVIAGISISYGVTAYAFRDNRFPIPVEEIREFTDVFGAIKANYVEPVEDKKLITEAINGMLTGLDPHSAYLDQEAFRERQVGNVTLGLSSNVDVSCGLETFACTGHLGVTDRRGEQRAGDHHIFTGPCETSRTGAGIH